MATVNGTDCVCYYGLLSETELEYVRSATLRYGTAEVDVTVRGSPALLTSQTILDVTFECELLYVPGDAGWEYLYGLYQSGEGALLLICDGIKTISATRGVGGYWTVVTFDRNEGVDGKVTFKVVCKATYDDVAFYVGVAEA